MSMKWSGMSLIVLFNASVYANFSEKNLNTLYEFVSGFSVDAKEYKAIEDQGGDPLYGEITFQGLEKLLKELKPGAHDVFYDLGCGVGKVCVQLLFTTPILKCVGIELSSTRIGHAQKTLRHLELQKKIPQNKQLRFLNENIKDANISDGTIFYLGCYGDEVMKVALENLSKIHHRIRFATIRKTIGHPEFRLIKTVSVPMTWSENVPVYIYEKRTKNTI